MARRTKGRRKDIQKEIAYQLWRKRTNGRLCRELQLSGYTEEEIRERLPEQIQDIKKNSWNLIARTISTKQRGIVRVKLDDFHCFCVLLYARLSCLVTEISNEISTTMGSRAVNPFLKFIIHKANFCGKFTKKARDPQAKKRLFSVFKVNSR